jgi:hypothetical protein
MPDLVQSESQGRLDDSEVEQRLGRLDEVLDRLESVPGPTADAGVEAVQLLSEVYGEALARVLDLAPRGLVHELADDQLVGHLLVLHELHPDPVEARVRRALDDLRPHVGALELLSVEDGVARVRLPEASGCGAARRTEAVRETVLAMAPELRLVDAQPAGGDARLQLSRGEALPPRPAAPAPVVTGAGGPP